MPCARLNTTPRMCIGEWRYTYGRSYLLVLDENECKGEQSHCFTPVKVLQVLTGLETG